VPRLPMADLLRRVLILGASVMACASSAAGPPASASAGPVSGPAPSRTVSEILVRVRDGRELKAVLSVPEGKGPFPVLVAVHGGQGDRPIQVMREAASPQSEAPTVQMFNRQEWIILAPDYRTDWMGAEETDIVDAVRFAATLPGADPRRVGVFGGSNGGRLTLRAAILDPSASPCIAAGSPFLTDPHAFFRRDLTRPPWSLFSPAARAWNTATRQRLEVAVTRSARRQGLSFGALLDQNSVVANAGAIRASVLLMTSHADAQVPHVMLESLIESLRGSRRAVSVVTVDNSLHGFYWGREGEFGSREGAGEKTEVQLAEEARVREAILDFFTSCFADPSRS